MYHGKGSISVEAPNIQSVSYWMPFPLETETELAAREACEYLIIFLKK